MANRYTTQFINNLQKGVNKINATVSFGAAGAPTIDRSGFQSQGLVSVTRDGAGIFTFVFGTQVGMLDVYTKLLGVSACFNTVGAPGVPAAPLYYVSGNAVSTPASCSVQLTFLDADTPAATDPGNGEVAYIEFTLKNSTAP